MTLGERGGQSLIEILVAVAIGVILIAGALSIVAPTAKTSGDTARIQVASALGKELLDNTRAMADGNWHALDALATTSANKFYIAASTSPFVATTGIESIQISTTTYTRYFYLDYVYRNGQGQIDSAGTAWDPSTRRITVVYGWNNYVGSSTSYFSRAADSVFYQQDWAGGGNQAGPVTATSTTNQFATSSNLTTATTSGGITIKGY